MSSKSLFPLEFSAFFLLTAFSLEMFFLLSYHNFFFNLCLSLQLSHWRSSLPTHRLLPYQKLRGPSVYTILWIVTPFGVSLIPVLTPFKFLQTVCLLSTYYLAVIVRSLNFLSKVSFLSVVFLHIFVRNPDESYYSKFPSSNFISLRENLFSLIE